MIASTVELTDSQWEIADTISHVVESEPDRLWTPSALARKARCSTGAAAAVIRWMERASYITGVGNGSWRKYRARRFGERWNVDSDQ